MNALEGIRILDLSRLLPGPYATQLLADLGAEVVKVERPPAGDYARLMPPLVQVGADAFGAVFAQNNLGKKSLGLDFGSTRGRELLLRLVETADVLLESSRPGTMKRHGLDWESVGGRNPRLVYCSLSGYGAAGPYRDRAGHDLNYLALAGVLNLNGSAASAPVPMPVQAADLAGGMLAAARILAALVERARTGRGQFLDLALFDAAVGWMETVVGGLYRAQEANPRRGEMPLTGAYPCYQIYETSDRGFMSLAALEPGFWRNFCESLDRPDLIAAQFDADAIPVVAAIFRSRTRGEWIDFSRRVDACLEPLLEISETLAHPQVQARRLALEDSRRVPRLGEDTRTILQEIGCSAEEIEAMENAGIVVSADAR